MTWPLDDQPRFIVTSLTGWPITDGLLRPLVHRKSRTTYYVSDRANCHQVIAEFHSPAHGAGTAEQLAEILNEPSTEPQGWTLVRRLRDDRHNALNRLSDRRRQRLHPTAASRGEAVSAKEGTEPSSCSPSPSSESWS